MEEARYSFNLKLTFNGFDSQFTMRADQEPAKLILEVQQLIHHLVEQGGRPTSPRGGGSSTGGSAGSNDRGHGHGNGRQNSTCPTCRQVDQVELIEWSRDGRDMHAWKCQRCSKWMPKTFEPPQAPSSAAASAPAIMTPDEVTKLWD